MNYLFGYIVLSLVIGAVVSALNVSDMRGVLHGWLDWVVIPLIFMVVFSLLWPIGLVIVISTVFRPRRQA